MAANGYQECSRCGKWYAAGTLNTEFEGWGRRTVTPKGWHCQSEVKRTTFAVEKPVCEACGGGKKESAYQEPLWKRAKEAWKTVDGDMLKMRGKR